MAANWLNSSYEAMSKRIPCYQKVLPRSIFLDHFSQTVQQLDIEVVYHAYAGKLARKYSLKNNSTNSEIPRMLPMWIKISRMTSKMAGKTATMSWIKSLVLINLHLPRTFSDSYFFSFLILHINVIYIIIREINYFHATMNKGYNALFGFNMVVILGTILSYHGLILLVLEQGILISSLTVY